MGDRGFDHAGFGASVKVELKRVVTVEGIKMGGIFCAYAARQNPGQRIRCVCRFGLFAFNVHSSHDNGILRDNNERLLGFHEVTISTHCCQVFHLLVLT